MHTSISLLPNLRCFSHQFWFALSTIRTERGGTSEIRVLLVAVAKGGRRMFTVFSSIRGTHIGVSDIAFTSVISFSLFSSFLLALASIEAGMFVDTIFTATVTTKVKRRDQIRSYPHKTTPEKHYLHYKFNFTLEPCVSFGASTEHAIQVFDFFKRKRRIVIDSGIIPKLSLSMITFSSVEAKEVTIPIVCERRL